MRLLSLALNPSAGEPVEQVLNSHGWVSTWGGALEEPVPDRLSAGQDKTTYQGVSSELRCPETETKRKDCN